MNNSLFADVALANGSREVEVVHKAMGQQMTIPDTHLREKWNASLLIHVLLEGIIIFRKFDVKHD